VRGKPTAQRRGLLVSGVGISRGSKPPPFDEEVEGRLDCDYINKYGETVFPKKPGTSEKDYFITYAEFDLYDAFASELYEKLYELWNSDAVTPITEDELRHVIEVEEAINSSDNVVRFPEKPQLDDED
jgi:hypothetical protein